MAATACGLVLSWMALAAAQTLTPTNFTNITSTLQVQNSIELTFDVPNVKKGAQSSMTALLSLTDVSLNKSIQGTTFLVDDTNASNLQGSRGIVYISCDPPAGLISQSTVLNEAIASGPYAVVLYSTQADYCNLTSPPDFSYIYSLKSANASSWLLNTASEAARSNVGQIWSYIAPTGVARVASDIANSTSPTGPDGSSPTTEIAMIILYTITGIITVLFLAIIITGAIRAHRHPERYGLRAAAGRPRRSRAHGLARAMLDSLPIVKFGDHDDATAHPKPTELELGNTPHGPVETLETSRDAPASDATSQPKSAPQPNPSPASPAPAQDPISPGINPATNPTPPTASRSSADVPGCSICTDDFELGQDQRVLPCSHRFHPACVDPWLLNVSGTCPLCRIDLHPPRRSRRRGAREGGESAAEGGEEGEEEEEGEGDEEDGNPSDPETETLPPPLGRGDEDDARARQRLSIRRSIMIGLMGSSAAAAQTRRPENMSGEERVAALRRLRARLGERRAREETAEVRATPEEERRFGARVRDLIGRRRRTAMREAERGEGE